MLAVDKRGNEEKPNTSLAESNRQSNAESNKAGLNRTGGLRARLEREKRERHSCGQQMSKNRQAESRERMGPPTSVEVSNPTPKTHWLLEELGTQGKSFLATSDEPIDSSPGWKV